VIGKSLSQRVAPGPLAAEQAAAVMKEMLPSQAENLVRVRARGAGMVAFLVVRADAASVRIARALGLEVKRGGTVVFGVAGVDAARLLVELPAPQRAWLEAPCAARETKVFLLAGGTALVTLDTTGGTTAVRVEPG
jgi:hypothetical protein